MLDVLYWIGVLAGWPVVLLCVSGVIISIVGAMFQINDQAFGFSIKMIVLTIVIGLSADLMWEKFCAWVSTILCLL